MARSKQDPDLPSRGARDAAAALPFIALALLMPPIVLIFARPAFIAGVPLVIVYIFGIWIVMVAAAFLIARKLEPAQDAPAGPAVGAHRFDADPADDA